MERIIYYPETLLQTSAVPPRTFTETGFLAGLISDGQEPEHRSGRDHLLPCSTPTRPPRCLSESARGPGNELPNSTTSSKFYRENPRNHIVQTLAFPLNSLYRAPHSCSGMGSRARSTPRWGGYAVFGARDSLQSKGLSRVFSNTTVQKQQFFGTQPSSQSNSHIHT